MPRDYLLQDPAISYTMATGYRPGDEWECNCHECGESLDQYDSYEIFDDGWGNWYCPDCARQWTDEENEMMEEVS